MIPEYKALLEKAVKDQKFIAQKVRGMQKKKKAKLDSWMHEKHELAFRQIDCLSCANCCRTTGPLLTSRDIEKIARHLKLKPGTFTEKYLQIDEENDYVFKSMPCPFLGDDNYCSIYEFRPKACREYPHTDRKNQNGILSLTKKNALICPAVAHIFLSD